MIENNIEEFNSIFDTFLGVEVHDGLLKNLKIRLVISTNTILRIKNVNQDTLLLCHQNLKGHFTLFS